MLAQRCLVFATCGLLLIGCHNGDDDDAPRPIATIELQPTDGSVLIGATLQLAATARDARGAALTDRTFAWTSLSPEIAAVSASGLVSGLALGDATITVSAEEQTVTTNLRVTQLRQVIIRAERDVVSLGGSIELTTVIFDSASNEVDAPVNWSSADAAIAMVSQSGTVSGIGEGVTSITASVSTASAGAVSHTRLVAVQQPVLGKIAFFSDRDRIGNVQGGGVFLMLPDGSQPTLAVEERLDWCMVDPPYSTHGRCFFPWAGVAMSPDGMELAATSRVIYAPEWPGPGLFVCASAHAVCARIDYSQPTSDLFGGPKRLANVGEPAWSHDGTRIVFGKSANFPNPDSGILVLDRRTGTITIIEGSAGSSQPVTIIEPSPGSSQPVWSPDDARIAFVSSRSGNRDIWVMNADGTQPINLTNHPADDVQPSWAADGTIAFVSNRDGNNEIYVMGADGSSQINLTHNPSNDQQPDWSADSLQLVFETDRDGNSEIYSMYRDGSSQTNLTRHPAEDTYPSWGPPLR